VAALFVIALLALVAGVGIVALIETEPGYLLIAYAGYTVETSFWVGIVLIAVVVLALYALLRFLASLWSSPSSVLNWASARRLRQSQRLTTRGLISFTEGNWAKARRQLLRGARYHEAPLLNYLLAARASYRLEEPDEVRRYLLQAAESDQDAEIAVDLTKAEMQINAGQFGDALRTLALAAENPGRRPYVLQLLYRAHEGLGNHEDQLRLLPELRRSGVRPAAELNMLEAQLCHSILEEAAGQGDSTALQACWKSLPAWLRDDVAEQLHYYEAMIACGESAKVEKILVKRLRRDWDAGLVLLYGRIPREGAQKPLAIARGWLKQHGDDPDLLLTLGRLAMQERQWQQARDYLERSQRIRPSEEACLELGRLLTAVGDHAAAAAAFYAGAQLRGSTLPDLPQPNDVVPGHHRLEEGDTDAVIDSEPDASEDDAQADADDEAKGK
jgi:HemY protein